MNHYQRHHVYATKTRGEQDSDCVEFFSHNTPLPYKYSAENAIIAARELAYALKNPAPQVPFFQHRRLPVSHNRATFQDIYQGGR